MIPTAEHVRPEPMARTGRAREIMAAARALLERDGPDGVTMRAIADELGIRAPSLYKHFGSKSAVEDALVDEALFEMGDELRTALARPGRHGPVAALLRSYRTYGSAHPELYRLVTAGTFRREALTPGLEDWTGEAFFLVTGDPHLAQALFAFAHGTLSLEIDDRFQNPDGLDRTWAAGAAAFAAAVVG